MSGKWRTSDKFKKHADKGRCEYCDKDRMVKPEPFGSKPACEECWNQIVFGEAPTTPPKVVRQKSYYKPKPRCKVVVNGIGLRGESTRSRCKLAPDHQGRHLPV